MRFALVAVVTLLGLPAACGASELSMRGMVGPALTLESEKGWDAPGKGPVVAGGLLWTPGAEGALRLVIAAQYWRVAGERDCELECGEFQIRTSAYPVGVGVRAHVGDRSRRSGSLYLEVVPAVVYVQQSIEQTGNMWGENYSGRETQWAAGILASVLAPVALTERLSLEVGVGYLWTEDLAKPTGSGFFQGDLSGIHEVSATLGVALR